MSCALWRGESGAEISQGHHLEYEREREREREETEGKVELDIGKKC